MRIENGDSKKVYLKINDDGSAKVDAVTRPKILSQSEDKGLSYVFTTDILSFGTAATEYNILYFKNTSADENFKIATFYMSYNGGTVSGLKVADVKLKLATADPTANTTAITPGNLNTGSSNSAETTAYKWNGTGTGITVTTQTAGVVQIRSGLTHCEFSGFILAPGQAIVVSYNPAEIGTGALTITGYYELK